MYARINEKGYPEFYTKRHIRNAGRLFINPTEENMRMLGYKPLRKHEPPCCSDDEVVSISYADTGDYIEEVYTVIGG